MKVKENYKEELQMQLSDISDFIEKHYREEKNLGVLNGIAGAALFQFFYSDFTKNVKYADRGAQMIKLCIERINDGYSYPTFCSGLAGFGWAVQHLEEQGFLNLDSDSFLTHLDDYLHRQMIIEFEHRHYDYLHGALGYTHYFFTRFTHTKKNSLRQQYGSYLKQSLEKLAGIAIDDQNGIKWLSIIDIESGEKGYDLGLSHGLAGVINILCKLAQVTDLSDIARSLLAQCVSYLAQWKNDKSMDISMYPAKIPISGNPEYNSILGWCYGDLGIGISLRKAAYVLGDEALLQKAEELLLTCATRKNYAQTFVVDPAFCHGAYGNAYCFLRLFSDTGQKAFLNASLFWIYQGLKFLEKKNTELEYINWIGEQADWHSPISLLMGATGIGLSQLSCLTNSPDSWDSCLLLS